MYESDDDLTVPWLGGGVELALRMLALADEIDVGLGMAYADAAERIREVIRCEYDPRRHGLPQLGDPPPHPVLRRAAPRRPERGL